MDVNRQTSNCGPLVQWLSYLAIGFGAGWITGLSVSPVVNSLVGAVLGLAGGVLATVGSVKSPENLSDARPLAIMVVGLIVGTSTGITVRTHGLLETTDSSVVSEAERSRRWGVLFSNSIDQCGRLAGSPDDRLRSALQTSSFEWATSLERHIPDDHTLRNLVMQICE